MPSFDPLVRRAGDVPNSPGEGGDDAANPHADGDSGAPNPGDNVGLVLEMQIERELKDSYLTYAMSTIMDRALPDVRDGLKPSQRRILFGMHELRVTPGRKHLKCARIVGEVMGKYHPHGDLALYGTLVGMAQSWRSRMPMVDPQGNFGSIVPDPPAAMRYTEARLAPAAMDMLEDLDLGTVDMVPNYDEQHSEPSILPARFPYLLVNGAVGIAVGMATSMAPNNPIEVLDAIIRTIDKPAISLAELMQDVYEDAPDASDDQAREGTPAKSRKIKYRGIKGPDFPTGGVIMGRRGIIEGYETGRGKVTVRARMHTETVPGTKDREQIVVDEVPFNVTIETLTEQLNVALKEDKITDMSAVYNESNAKNPLRIVIELRRGADAGVVEKQLYEFTSLQSNFSVNSIALVNRQPRTLSLRELLRHYIDHRVDVIRRRTAHLLDEARRKAHVLEGMIYAVCDIDEVIRLIRSSRTRIEAIDKLMDRRFRIPAGHPAARLIPSRLLDLVRAAETAAGGIALSRIQAETIGNMRLIQLVGLEIEKIVADYRALIEEIEQFERILATRQLVLDMIKTDCEAMKARFNTPRLTEVQDAEGEDLTIAALIPVMDCAVTISHHGYAKRVPADTYRAQGRGGKGIIGGAAKDDDFIEHVLVASTHDDLLCFTDTGRVFKLKVFELPELPRTSKGRPLVNLLDFRTSDAAPPAPPAAGDGQAASPAPPVSRPEKAIAFLTIKNFEEGSHFLTFVSRNGIVKRTPLKDYRNVNKGGLIAVDIREGDALLNVALTTGTDDLLLVSAGGQAIRFPEDDVRVMGRSAGGVKGIELEDADAVVGVITIHMQPGPDADDPNARLTNNPALTLLTITEHGYGKRTLVDEYRVQPESGPARSQSRGGKGRVDIRTSARNGRSVAALGVNDFDDVMVGTKDGQLVRIPARTISTYGRGTQGVRIVKLNEGDQVSAAARVDADPESDSPPAADTTSEPTPSA
ncbi:MAG: DNA topoisomerase (ATP-hydrolyzing) subunit A [Phycisphaerales bacterium]